jgi:uncharacterized protein
VVETLTGEWRMADNPKQPSFVQGDLCHFELPIKNLERAKGFYGKIFGWQFHDHPEIQYTTFTTPGNQKGGSAVGGGLLQPTPDMPFRVTNYLCVDSIEEAAAKVKQLGGKLLNEKTEVQGFGWMQHFEDPEGNLLALWKPAPR